MDSVKEVKRLINQIKQRNKRVEADKAWEASFTRKLIIAIATYLIMTLFLFLINAPKPWLNSLIPAGAYVLSTLTMPFLKKWWINNIYKK